MRKIIAAVASVTALAGLIAPTVASADVQRNQEQNATFTVLQPRNVVGQYGDVWKHDFTITINPCTNTFEGTGKVTANGQGDTAWTENITGSFGANSVSFATVPNAGATFRVTDAPYNTSVVAGTTWTQNIVEMMASKPIVTGSTTYKNHGQYVSAVGGGDDAAHSCIGMPIQSSK